MIKNIFYESVDLFSVIFVPMNGKTPESDSNGYEYLNDVEFDHWDRKKSLLIETKKRF